MKCFRLFTAGSIFLFIFITCMTPVLAISLHEYADEISFHKPLVEQNSSLRVALYPYISDVNHDDNKYLLSIMKQQFQTLHPSINLTLDINQSYDCYNLTNLPNIFSEDGPQLVEADLSLLGYLVDNGYVKPFDDESLEKNILPQAIPAGRYLGTTYAIPTWICAQFLFSRNGDIQEIHNVRELNTVYSAHSSEYEKMLTSDFQGGDVWLLPMFYVFANTDNSGYADMDEALYGPINQSDVTTMGETMDWCTVDGTNDCLNGYYGEHSPIKVFSKNESFSYNGFSENLYNIMKVDPNSTYYTISTPYGNDQNTLIWVDGLLVNRKACDDVCMEDAAKFVAFYNSLPVKNLIAFSEDAYTPVPPRYVLPPTEEFYHTEKAESNRYYPMFKKAIDSSESFPSSGITKNIRQRYAEICSLLKQQIPDTSCIC